MKTLTMTMTVAFATLALMSAGTASAERVDPDLPDQHLIAIYSPVCVGGGDVTCSGLICVAGDDATCNSDICIAGGDVDCTGTVVCVGGGDVTCDYYYWAIYLAHTAPSPDAIRISAV